MLLLLLAWQSPAQIVVDAGGLDDIFLSGFYPQESADGRSYRWSEGRAGFFVPGAGVGGWDATITLASGRPPEAGQVPFSISAGGRTLGSFSAGPDYQDFSFAIPPGATRFGDLDLAIETGTFRPPGENRDLGLAVDRLALTPTLPLLPAPVAWAALALALLLLSPALRLVVSARGELVFSAVAALMVAGVVAWDRPAIAPFASYLLMIAGGICAGLYVFRACWQRFANQAPAGPMLALLPALAAGFGLLWLGGQITVLSRQPLPDDFVAMLRGAAALAAGESPYQPDVLSADPFGPAYKYPPLFALLLEPLLGLPPRVALGAWNTLSLFALGAALFALLRAHGRTLRQAAPATLALLFLALVFQPVVDTLTYGQLDLALLGLVALAYWALRADRPLLAGPPLALAVLIKLYPGVLLLYLLWRREWRALASTAAAALLIVAVAALFTGVEPWRVYLAEVLPATGGGTAWVENQSFNGFLARLFADRIELEVFPAGDRRAPLLALATYAWAALVLLACWWSVRTPAGREGDAYALGFGAWTAASVLVLPAAWFHYPTLFLLPLGIALFAFENGALAWMRAQPRRTAGIALLLGFSAVLLAYGSHGIVWRGVNLGGLWKLGLSYKFYGMVGLTLAIILMLRLIDSRRSQAAEQAEVETEPGSAQSAASDQDHGEDHDTRG